MAASVNPLLLLPTPPAPRFRFNNGIAKTSDMQKHVLLRKPSKNDPISSPSPSLALEEPPHVQHDKLAFDVQPYRQIIDDLEWDPYAETQPSEVLTADSGMSTSRLARS
jgi:hypothetical protein